MTALVRWCCWIAAAGPIAAMAFWASFGAAFPEPLADRQAIGEAAPQWLWEDWQPAAGQPLHLVARALHRAALDVPGATLSSVAWLIPFTVVLLIALLAVLLRRSLAVSGWATPFAVLVCGALAGSPAFGSDWIYGQRVGLVLAPIALVAALVLLHGERLFTLRLLGSALLVAAAPLCHLHGGIVWLVCVPAVCGAALRNGWRSGWAWSALVALSGIAATAWSLHQLAGWPPAGAAFVERALAAPAAAARAALRATGGAWLDPIQQTDLDELALGAASWLAPLLLLFVGDRSAAARAAAAPWWGCLWFGLLLVPLTAARGGLDYESGFVRQAAYGQFLLPIGLLGVIAARFGRPALAFGGGALCALALQDWYDGIADLRLARLRAESVAAAELLREPAGASSAGPFAAAATRDLLLQRGWIPDPGPPPDPLQIAFDAPADDDLGTVNGGDAEEWHGTARSSLRRGGPARIAVVAEDDHGGRRIIGWTEPQFAGHGRAAPWRVRFAAAEQDGVRLRAFALLVPQRVFAPLGPPFVLQDGRLRPAL